MNAQVLTVFVVGVMTIMCGCGTSTTTDTTPVVEFAHAESAESQENEVDTFYTVADFVPGANPSDNLIATVSQASTGKRIILEIGGQW